MEQSSAAVERSVVESLLDYERYEEIWQRLPASTYFAAWRAVNARALGVLAAITLQQLAHAQAASGTADVYPWVSRAIDAARTTELNEDVLTQAWLADQHDRGVRLATAHPDRGDATGIGALRAVLGARLMAAELDGDSVRVRQLTKDASDPVEVRESLVQLADALARDLAEATGGSRETVLRALVADADSGSDSGL
ncbi:MAG: hypothetical protein QM286_05660 [Acidobacteriota bacterium]|nr:hypothetical protein [Acidobacteriota bacterium]